MQTAGHTLLPCLSRGRAPHSPPRSVRSAAGHSTTPNPAHSARVPSPRDHRRPSTAYVLWPTWKERSERRFMASSTTIYEIWPSPWATCWPTIIATTPLPADAIIPVPLAPAPSARTRIQPVGAAWHSIWARPHRFPVRCDLLRRHRYTRSQTRLNAQQRSQNVQGAFSCAEQHDAAQAIAGKRVLLIDDVATTGATLRACAQALRAQGARSVWALTVARAAPDTDLITVSSL